MDDQYFLVYRDKLVKKQINDAVEAEKIKWQEQATRQTKVPTSNPASPKVQTQGATDGLSFEQMLEEAAKKKAR